MYEEMTTFNQDGIPLQDLITPKLHEDQLLFGFDAKTLTLC